MGEYKFTDPVEDEDFPNITKYDPDKEICPDNLFPPAWGSEPTERDQAAIDAGHGGEEL